MFPIFTIKFMAHSNWLLDYKCTTFVFVNVCVCVCVFRMHKMTLRILFILLTLTMKRMWSMPNWMPSNLSNICENRLINGQLEADDANEAKRCIHTHTLTCTDTHTNTCITLALTLQHDRWLIGSSLSHQPIVLFLLCGFFRIYFSLFCEGIQNFALDLLVSTGFKI